MKNKQLEAWKGRNYYSTNVVSYWLLQHKAYNNSLLLGRQLSGNAYEETNIQSAIFQRDLRQEVKQLASNGLRMA